MGPSRTIRSRLAATVLAGALAAATLAARDARGAASADPASPLDEVAALVEDHFYDPGALGERWRANLEGARRELATGGPQALDGVLDRLLASLGASHTARYTREDLEYFHLLAAFRPMFAERHPELYADPGYDGIGAWTTRRDGGAFVAGVFGGSPAARAGLLAGDELLAVDGRTWAGLASFAGRAGERVELRLRRAAGAEPIALRVVPERIAPEAALAAAMRESAALEETGGARVGYVRVWSYAGEVYHEELVELLAGPLAAADALVLDLRGGLGGADPSYLSLFRPGFPRLTYRDREGVERSYERAWRKPVVLLVDRDTRSGKEVMAHAFRRGAIGPVVGERTAGAVLGGRPFVLSDGSLLYLAVLEARVDGERLEGVGVAPDVEVPFDLRWSAGADPPRRRALEVAAGLARRA